MTNPKADMTYLRNAYLLGGVTSASVYLYLWAKSPFPMKELFFSGLSNSGQAVTKNCCWIWAILEIRFPQHLRSRLVLDCTAVLGS
jgi:hypothetical protein